MTDVFVGPCSSRCKAAESHLVLRNAVSLHNIWPRRNSLTPATPTHIFHPALPFIPPFPIPSLASNQHRPPSAPLHTLPYHSHQSNPLPPIPSLQPIPCCLALFFSLLSYITSLFSYISPRASYSQHPPKKKPEHEHAHIRYVQPLR